MMTSLPVAASHELVPVKYGVAACAIGAASRTATAAVARPVVMPATLRAADRRPGMSIAVLMEVPQFSGIARPMRSPSP